MQAYLKTILSSSFIDFNQWGSLRDNQSIEKTEMTFSPKGRNENLITDGFLLIY